MQSTATPAPTELAAIAAPFIKAVRSVFSTMVGVPITVNALAVRSESAPTYDISGIIGFSGTVIGSVVVSFQRDAAMRVVQSFAGTTLQPGTPDFADALGELANMIAGAAKNELAMEATISIPTVVLGSGHSVDRLTDVPCVVVPCSTTGGDFAVEINIKRTGKAA